MNVAAFSMISVAGLAFSASAQSVLTIERELWPLVGEGFDVSAVTGIRDVDGDGLPDLVSGGAYRPNNGDRAFGAAAALPDAGDCSVMIDLDRDGDLDCYEGFAVSQPDRVDARWRERLGDGSLAEESLYELPAVEWTNGDPFGGVATASVRVVDLDSDGEMELLRVVLDPYQSADGYGVLDYLEPGSVEAGMTNFGTLGFTSYDYDSHGLGPDLDGDGVLSAYVDEYDFGFGDNGAIVRTYYSNTGGGFAGGAEPFVVDPFDPYDAATRGAFVRSDDGEAARLVTFAVEEEGGLVIDEGTLIGLVREPLLRDGALAFSPVGQLRLDFSSSGFGPTSGEFIGFELARDAVDDLRAVGFDPDGDGDQDLLAEISFEFFGAGDVARTVVLLNQGNGDYDGKVAPKVRGAGEASALSGERPLGGFELSNRELYDLDGDGLWNELVLGDGTAAALGVSILSAGVAGDLSGDGVVGARDLAIVVSKYGQRARSADVDGDGVVGPRDVAVVLASWGAR